MASIRSMLRVLTLLGALAGLAAASTVEAGVNLPTPAKGKGEKCVEDTQFMRRNHMDLLKHHRNETMRKGIRTTRHSLKACVECHASPETGSVAAGKKDFCVSCHTYAAVKLDCWDCHATKPMKKAAEVAVAPAATTEVGTSPMMPAQAGGTQQ
jgi:hypothetical protein